MNNIEQFKEGIFNSHTRRFGTIAEIMIKKLYKLQDSNSLAFDKKDNDKKIEIKFSRVLKAHDETITENNVVSEILKANYNTRQVNSTDKYDYDCNIQQIKPNEFDILYYGLFFNDKIYIYKVDNVNVKNIIGYSNKQHRGNEGEGQFHINQSTIDYHNQNLLLKELNYNELYKLLKETEDCA